MNYTLMPSLEHMALVKIATTLWNQDHIRALMAKFKFPLPEGEREKWQEIENKIMEKVPQLSIPESLKEELLGFINGVGLRILKWMEYHNENCYSITGIDLPDEFCWTPQGTVDLKKMAEALIKDESLDVTSRYKLACLYCLEDNVQELWNRMPENHRKSLYSEIDPTMDRKQYLVVYWTCVVNGGELGNTVERNHGCSPYSHLFRYSVDCGKVATEYFLQKLTPGERKNLLVSTTGYVAAIRSHSASNRSDLPKEHSADVVCFLLSQMDRDQHAEVFKNWPVWVLTCLLEWPWQSLFEETANHMRDFLDGHGCYLLLSEIVRKVAQDHKDYDYQRLFKEFWQLSPNAHKRYFIKKCAKSRSLLPVIYFFEDKESIKLILKDATLAEKEEIIFNVGKGIISEEICNDAWNLLTFFIQECVPSKDAMVEFKKHFKKDTLRSRSGEFFQLLDELFHNKKRSMEQGESSSAKRVHS